MTHIRYIMGVLVLVSMLAFGAFVPLLPAHTINHDCHSTIDAAMMDDAHDMCAACAVGVCCAAVLRGDVLVNAVPLPTLKPYFTHDFAQGIEPEPLWLPPRRMIIG